uniref:ATPase inhibitor, mitochondrial n=1 Tax=Chelonoidis abingdonii TaxID=106734 RepID=A0A8C0GDY6_CHEAB
MALQPCNWAREGCLVVIIRWRFEFSLWERTLNNTCKQLPQVDPGLDTGEMNEGGGSICETRGAFRKKQVAEVDQYFRKYHEDAIDHQNEEINGLQKEIECHKNKIQKRKNDDY